MQTFSTKVLICTTVPQTISAFLLPYISHFRSIGWKIDVLTSDAEGVIPTWSDQVDNLHHVTWTRNPFNLLQNFSCLSNIRTLVKREQYDIVHVHTPVAGFLVRFALRALRKEGVKVIYTAHGFHFHPEGKPWKNFSFLAIEKVAARWTDFLVTINAHDYSAAKKYELVDERHLAYMPGIGVDVAALLRQATKIHPHCVREELNISTGSTVFLVVAEINANKSHRDIIHAFSRTCIASAYLLVAGEGPLLNKMKSLVVELGLTNRVHFLGYRKDIAKLIVASDAVILASSREGLPRSILEAMCLKRCVIGSRIRGIEDLLEANCGLLFQYGDRDKLTELMELVANDKKLKTLLEQNAFARVSKFDISELLKLHSDLYSNAISKHYNTKLPE